MRESGRPRGWPQTPWCSRVGACLIRLYPVMCKTLKSHRPPHGAWVCSSATVANFAPTRMPRSAVAATAKEEDNQKRGSFFRQQTSELAWLSQKSDLVWRGACPFARNPHSEVAGIVRERAVLPEKRTELFLEGIMGVKLWETDGFSHGEAKGDIIGYDMLNGSARPRTTGMRCRRTRASVGRL